MQSIHAWGHAGLDHHLKPKTVALDIGRE